MSMDWLRWYHGSVNDPKFTVIARKSGQPKTTVIAVWAALLESASQADPRGSLHPLEIDTLAASLDMDDAAAEAIISAMTAKGLIANNAIANWTKRQAYREDDSRDRVRRFREKQRETRGNAPVTPGNAPVTPGNAPVTPQITDTDTDTDTEQKIISVDKETSERKEVGKTKCVRTRVRAQTPTPKTPLPPDLAITPQLQAWAEQQGYGDLERHLVSFKDKATARGYQYADWMAAFRNAVRDDWAGLRQPERRPSARPAPPTDPQAAEFAGLLAGARRPTGRTFEGVIVHETD